jgi:hypothetical protein
MLLKVITLRAAIHSAICKKYFFFNVTVPSIVVFLCYYVGLCFTDWIILRHSISRFFFQIVDLSAKNR